MLEVAIIDDNEEFRTRLTKPIKRYFRHHDINWQVEHYDPLPELREYPKWIINKKVILLIVDEKLNITKNKKNGHIANYLGHDIVRLLRENNNNLPIVAISAFTAQLDPMKGDFDDILDREEFNDDSSQYLKRFVRLTNKYLENYDEQFKRLSDLSQSVALGSAKKNEIDELKALQSKLQLPVTSALDVNRSEWVDCLEGVLEELELLSDKIERHIQE
ncbi:hypothetical protein [Marinicella sp. W31]|uniref:hypothetical protein n=1 Tax=Marinicella sp. W31 TaxID=3023713 RepID=UPI003757C3AC